MRAALLGLVGIMGWAAATQAADAPPVPLSEGFRVTHTDGATLYRAICQGCHMADAQGASGAGRYPALAGNARLGSAPYVILTVLNGRKGMPGFGGALNDDQVAEVVRHVRTQFGNSFTEPVSAADVKALR